MSRLVPDRVWAALTIWQEGRGETHDGRVAVGEVIRHRMTHRYWSDGTVPGTVLMPFQFSGWNTQDHNRVLGAILDDSDPLVADCLAAWDESEHTNATLEAVLYFNPEAVIHLPQWAPAATRVAVVGHHHFYVPKVWRV